jgi:hypothetical protein
VGRRPPWSPAGTGEESGRRFLLRALTPRIDNTELDQRRSRAAGFNDAAEREAALRACAVVSD